MTTNRVPAPLPPQFRLTASPGLRLADQGTRLLGGAPPTVVRLSDAGARLVRDWLRGAPVAPDPAPVGLARRLIKLGLLTPVLAPHQNSGQLPQVGVVMPVYNDVEGLRLSSQTLGNFPTVVVDDGSHQPRASQVRTLVQANKRWQFVVHPSNRGPAAARQTGLSHQPSSVVAFVDAGVNITGDQLETLTRWFWDPEIVAVAPRVKVPHSEDPIGRYERTNSPLDMGSVGSLVGPSHMVRYVPSTVVLVRRTAIEAVGGFDEALRYGEDVDLIWRLGAVGLVMYDPTVEATHPPRPGVVALARQRYHYGSAAGPLEAKHGPAVAPLQYSGLPMLVVMLIASRRWRFGIGVSVAGWLRLGQKLDGSYVDPEALAAVLMVQSLVGNIRNLSGVLARDWWPLSLLVIAWGRGRPRQLVVATLVARWGGSLASRSSHQRGLSQVGLKIVDDMAYGLGVWFGAIKVGSGRSLGPHRRGAGRWRLPTGKRKDRGVDRC